MAQSRRRKKTSTKTTSRFSAPKMDKDYGYAVNQSRRNERQDDRDDETFDKRLEDGFDLLNQEDSTDPDLGGSIRAKL